MQPPSALRLEALATVGGPRGMVDNSWDEMDRGHIDGDDVREDMGSRRLLVPPSLVPK